jgi:hypothetical protein
MMHRCQPAGIAPLILLLFAGFAPAQEPPQKGPPPTTPTPPKKEEPASKPPAPPPAEAKLPMSDLPPAMVVPNLCLVHSRVSTASPDSPALFDQGWVTSTLRLD